MEHRSTAVPKLRRFVAALLIALVALVSAAGPTCTTTASDGYGGGHVHGGPGLPMAYVSFPMSGEHHPNMPGPHVDRTSADTGVIFVPPRA
jgi:hypothetical protein